MLKHIRYFTYLLTHKWYVMISCARKGIIWRGLVHDLSKYLPSEWFAFAERFYGKYSLNRSDSKFSAAWLCHLHRNPHHWQHWVLINSNGEFEALSIPNNYLLEMLSDWEGAGRAIHGRDDSREWYITNYNSILLHPDSRAYINNFFKIDPNCVDCISGRGTSIF